MMVATQAIEAADALPLIEPGKRAHAGVLHQIFGQMERSGEAEGLSLQLRQQGLQLVGRARRAILDAVGSCHPCRLPG